MHISVYLGNVFRMYQNWCMSFGFCSSDCTFCISNLYIIPRAIYLRTIPPLVFPHSKILTASEIRSAVSKEMRCGEERCALSSQLLDDIEKRLASNFNIGFACRSYMLSSCMSQVFRASSKMLSSDRSGFLGERSSFSRIGWWSEKKETSDGFQLRRLVVTLVIDSVGMLSSWLSVSMADDEMLESSLSKENSSTELEKRTRLVGLVIMYSTCCIDQAMM